MKTELNQKDKEQIEKARHLIEAANQLKIDAANLIKAAISDTMNNLAKDLKWQEMEWIACDLPDSVERFYALQHAGAIKEDWEKSRKIPY